MMMARRTRRTIHHGATALALIAVSGCLVAGCASEAGEAAAEQAIVANTVYTLTNVHAGLCMEVSGGSTANGANVQLWSCNYGTQQQFRLEPAGGGYYLLRNVASNKCVDVWGRSTANGANIAQWSCHGGTNQQFRVEAVSGPDVVRFVARHSGKALDGWNWGTTNGTNVAQWTVTGGANQSFVAQAVGGSTTPSPAVANRTEVTMALSSQTTISYGGYLNGESFQQDGILTYNGYQYTAYWNTGPRVVLARRAGGTGNWSKIEMASEYTGSSNDAHNTISLGVSPSDGRLHIAFDHHGSDLNYVRSVANLLNDPANVAWAESSFENPTDRLSGVFVDLVTYPRFVTGPDGRLLFFYRYGSSGSGDEVLWEYRGGTWTRIGTLIAGISSSVNGYLHGIEYQGSRIHAAWCWRDTPNASTNHDLLYAYSDDHGRTWRNNAGQLVGTTGSSPMTPSTSGLVVWSIGQNRGLINQESMIVDSAGRVHVLLSHMPDSAANDSNFTNARSRSVYHHYWRATNGVWSRNATSIPVQANLRGSLAVSSTGNLYAVLPSVRIASASASELWTNWSIVDSAYDGAYYSDPLIDRSRLRLEDVLTVFAPAAPASVVPIYTIDYDLE